MVLAPLLHALMKREDADVMLCSDSNLIRNATLYTYFGNWHTSQSKALKNIHNQLSRKSNFPGSGWKTSHIVPGWSYLKHTNVLEASAFLTCL